MKIAVIGSGISGLSAAYYLSKNHYVDLFEKEDHFGGHAHTIKIQYEGKKEVAVDIGFMGFNKKTYPHSHYDIYWNNATGLSDNRYGTDDLGFNDYPSRAEGAKSAEAKLYEQLGQN